jgi:hypothetical protein
MRPLLVCVALWATAAPPASAWHRLPRGADAWPASGREAIRGVTIGPIESSQQPGRGYGTEYSAALLDELARMGVNWISITPFGRLFALDDTLVKMDFEAPWQDNRLAVRRMVAQAHARGMRVMVIPHLWVEAGGWRGEIELGTPARWAEYHESYRSFVRHWARDAQLAGADAFSVGVECKSWSGRFPEVWRALIADVRAEFGGLLTYSANWDEAVDVLFWDQLDIVGINAFYPLADHSAATTEEYIAGAQRLVPGVAELATTLEMPVLFVEVGYTTRPDAAVEPWLWPDDMAEVVVDEREQARALDAILRAFIPEEWFAGFFVWRYYANIDDVSQEAIWGFSPHAKLAESVLGDAFAVRWGADPAPWPWIPKQPDLAGDPFAGLFDVAY